MDYVDIRNDRYEFLAKSSTIYPKFRLDILDKYEKNVVDEIVEDISQDNSGSISVNYQQGVRMSCSISFINKDNKYTPSFKTGMFWLGSKFKLYIGLADPDNDDIYWFSEGVYYVNNPTNNNNFSSKIVTINGIDKFGLLSGDLGYNQLTGNYRISAGQKIYDIIKSILLMDKGNGELIDYIDPLLDPLYKDEVLPYDINKSAGSYLGDILIELANILGANIYYDKTGRLVVSSGTTDISYSKEAAIWDFSDKETEYMDNSLTYDYTNVINSVTVIGNNTNDKIYSYTAENNNVFSPTRISYIGKKELAPIETAMAYNEDRAKDYAEFELNRKSILQSTISFNCSLIPTLDVNRVCTITDDYYGFNTERFIIQSLSFPLTTTSTMQVSASNIASLPYYDTLTGG